MVSDQGPDCSNSTLNRLFDVVGLPIMVTGGGRGIGAMMAETLVGAGARVYIVGRNADVLKETAARLAQLGQCIALPGNLATDDGVKAVVAQYTELENSLHALINNAGTAWAAPIEDYAADRFADVLAVNLVAPFRLAALLLPALRAGAAPLKPSRIVNVGSTDGTLPPRYESYAYSASKAGLHMLTRHLAYRLRGENIRVNAISPGLFETKMTSFRFRTEESRAEVLAEIPIGRAGTPDDAGGAALFLCAPASAYLTGVILPVDGGYTSLR